MNEPKFMPGPRTVECLRDERGQTQYDVYDKRHQFIATFDEKADAVLDAAAPDLLEAARDLARQPCSSKGPEDLEAGCCESCRARAAIAKATKNDEQNTLTKA